jgi:hypothetical protein
MNKANIKNDTLHWSGALNEILSDYESFDFQCEVDQYFNNLLFLKVPPFKAFLKTINLFDI